MDTASCTEVFFKKNKNIKFILPSSSSNNLKDSILSDHKSYAFTTLKNIAEFNQETIVKAHNLKKNLLIGYLNCMFLFNAILNLSSQRTLKLEEKEKMIERQLASYEKVHELPKMDKYKQGEMSL